MAETVISSASSIVVAIAAIIASAAAIFGVNTWRRQLHGTTEYDLARRVLIAVYKLRDSVRSFRSPLMWPAEWSDRPDREPGRSEGDARDHAYAHAKRWEHVQDTVSQLKLELLEAEALWGDRLKPTVDILDRLIHELFISTNMYLHAQRDLEVGKKAEDTRKYERVIWPAEDPDEFGNNLMAAVRRFEDELKRDLKRKN